jgi:hypothetical protein
VRVQLRAMGCERCELGVRREAGEMILREEQDSIDIEKANKWLRHENAKGAHIYIRPAGFHALSLIDDLTAEAIERMNGRIRAGGGRCNDRAGQGEQPRRPSRRRENADLRPLEEFHADAAYGGDLHRADMAWAKYAAGSGLTLEQIKDELLNGRDLSKKGNRKRQLEYAERTARKALEQMRG